MSNIYKVNFYFDLSGSIEIEADSEDEAESEFCNLSDGTILNCLAEHSTMWGITSEDIELVERGD